MMNIGQEVYIKENILYIIAKLHNICNLIGREEYNIGTYCTLHLNIVLVDYTVIRN